MPFSSFGSVFEVAVFVLLTSQLLGNVAVVQLARPNVEILGDSEKRFAWAIISFVATVGGNLTITGSAGSICGRFVLYFELKSSLFPFFAANIIVAEKARRLDPTSDLSFFQHYRICFWITLLCCGLGSLIIFAINSSI